MAEKNCQACADLQNDAPNLVLNGMGSTEVASLKNNTGLNPSSGNDDCEDLNNMNDCLIGNLEDEIDAYDVCEWKEFTKNFVNNAWTVFKGIIAAICGLWTQISDLKKKNDALCNLIDALINPPASRYGTLLNTEGAEHPTRRGGTIGIKSGQPVVTPMARSELSDVVWDAQNMGIYLGSQKVSRCSDGKCQNYEWIAPSTIGYRVNENLELAIGDILWYATKSECTSWGMSEDMWNTFTISSWTWKAYGLAGSTKRANVWLKLSVDNNRLEMTYQGYVGDEQTTANRPINEETEPLKRYIYSC